MPRERGDRNRYRKGGEKLGKETETGDREEQRQTPLGGRNSHREGGKEERGNRHRRGQKTQQTPRMGSEVNRDRVIIGTQAQAGMLEFLRTVPTKPGSQIRKQNCMAAQEPGMWRGAGTQGV